MTKALLHDLGKSLSFGRLSLLGKVLWPMLLASSDDQGRGLAEADAVKWYICPNVPELTPENIPALFEEMTNPRIDMIILYTDERGRLIYQIKRWWEYQRLQWAQPSRYAAPDGWADRLRYREGGKYCESNWKQNDGGQSLRDIPESQGECSGEHSGEATNQTKPNQCKSTETQEPANAGAQKPPQPPPPSETVDFDTPEARILKAKLQATAKAKGRRGPLRFETLEQKRDFLAAVQVLGPEFGDLLHKAMREGCTSRARVVSYLVGCAKNKGNGAGKARGTPAGNEPAGFVAIREWLEIKRAGVTNG